MEPVEGQEGPICQSCGMPMRREEDFGTESKGGKNEEYCNFCFKDGDFTDAGITMEQKIEKLVEIATSQMDMPEAQAREIANSALPRLKRWRK